MFVRNFIALLLVVFVGASSLHAAKLKTWTVQGASAYADGRFDNTVVSNNGTVRLAHALQPMAAKIDAAHVWDMIEDKEGNLFVATGSEGRLLRITPAGEATILFENKTGPIISLALAPDGTLFAGTGPDGRILKMMPNGSVKVFCETGESYIWALVYQPSTEALFAATGPGGRIIKVSPQGTALTFLQTKQEHVLCLARGEGAALYAGTDKQGLIYRVDAQGKGFVLYQAPQGEVRSLLVSRDAVYAGTAAPTKKRGGPAATSKETSSETEKNIVKAASSSAPAAGENSIYRIGFDGAVREIFREKAQMLCLLKVRDKLLVGTGMDGKLFEIDETTRDFAEIARPDAGQIMRLLLRNDGSVLLGTGDSGQLLSLQKDIARKGTVLSEVYDAKLVSKWGAFTWRADVPKSSELTVATRGGNTSEPDGTWSDWSSEVDDAATAAFTGPACRFAQFRVSMKSTDGKSSPILHSVSLRYATANQAPEVTSLETPDPEAAPKDPKKVRVKWTATDANEDELTFDLFIRKDGWNDWIRIEENVSKSEYEWDTTTTPSGVYQLRVVASDRTDNPGTTALAGSRESAPIIVAHEGPRVALKLEAIEEGKATFSATASAALVRIASAQYSVNGKRWENVFPTDGLFDGKEKAFRFQSEMQTSGAYVIVFRVKDVAGNLGAADAVFNVPKK